MSQSMHDVLQTGSHGRDLSVIDYDLLTQLPAGWGVNTFVDGYQAHNRKTGLSRQVTYISRDFATVVREAHRIVSYAKSRRSVRSVPISEFQLSIFAPDVPALDPDMPF